MKLEPAAAIEQLTNHQQQADMDGMFVTVSRQALEEVLDYLRTPPASQSDEALVEELARALSRRHGLIFDEVCGYEAGGEECDSSTCIGAMDEDHDVEWNRESYRRDARAILPIIATREAAARAEGRRKGIEEAAQEETGWLIEHADEPKWLILSTAEAGGGLDWTKDSNAAVRFARREDAEAYVWAHFGGDGPIRITEHRWG